MDKMRLSALGADDGSANETKVVPIRTSKRYRDTRTQVRKWRTVKDLDREIVIRHIAILEAEREIKLLKKRKRKILGRSK